MAITVTKIAEEANPNNLTTYPDSTATQPAADKGLLWAIWVHSSGDPGSPSSITAYGVTWTQIASVLVGTTARLLVYEAYSGSSPTSTTASLTMGVACSGCSFSIHELGGVDMTDFTVQVVTNSGTGTTATVTFGTLADGTNNAEVMFTGNLVNAVVTPDATATWTELADLGHNSPTARHHAQWRTGTDLTATSTWSGSAGWAAVGVEVKMASTGPTGSGGGDAPVTVTAAGDGTRLEQGTGGGISTVTTTAAGGGTPLEKGTGGGDAAVSVVATGGGSAGVPPTGSGGGDAAVAVTAAGGGREGHSGGGVATVTATAAGGGMWGHTSGGVATVTVTGQGGGKEGHASGGVADITVTATGGGSGPPPAGSGGSDAPVLVSATGGGTAFVPAGGGDAAVLVGATGGGEGEVGVFTGPWVGTLGVRVDTATVLVEET